MKMSVYILHHVRPIDGGDEDVKLIGVYSSNAFAQSAILRLSHLPGFSKWPDCFEITEYTLDEDNWTEGFGVDTEDETNGSNY